MDPTRPVAPRSPAFRWTEVPGAAGYQLTHAPEQKPHGCVWQAVQNVDQKHMVDGGSDGALG